MKQLILFALLFLCRAENTTPDTTGRLEGSWSNEDGMMLNCNQTGNTLNATFTIPCVQEYKVVGNITRNNTFYLFGTANTTAIGITGQLFKTNKNQILKITLMKYDYVNCTKYTPTQFSSHELKLNRHISNSKDSHKKFNCQADMWSFENFNEEEANCSLDGIWYNDLGSSMVVRQNQDGLLEGRYYTAVEYENGSSGSGSSLFYGVMSRYSVFSFGVVWKKGESITVFIGQCVPLATKDTMLKTEWSLIASQKSINTSWPGFSMGWDNFYKERKFASIWSSVEGLRIHFQGPKNALTAKVVLPCGGQYTVKGALTQNNTLYLYGATKPTAIGITGALTQNNILYMYGATKPTAIGITGLFFRTGQGQILTVKVMKYDKVSCTEYTPTKISSYELKPDQTYNTDPNTFHNLDTAGDYDSKSYNQASECNLNGTWYNDVGSSLVVIQNKNGSLEGEYHTAVESNALAGGESVPLHGITSSDVFSFAVAVNNGTFTTVFIGQCVSSVNNPPVLKTQWLLVAAQKTIATSWGAFYTEMDNFYKELKAE